MPYRKNKGLKMCNEGKIDRTVRVIVGLGLIGFGIATQSYIVAAVGAIPLFTGIFGFCPLYALLKIDTGCKK